MDCFPKFLAPVYVDVENVSYIIKLFSSSSGIKLMEYFYMSIYIRELQTLNKQSRFFGTPCIYVVLKKVSSL